MLSGVFDAKPALQDWVEIGGVRLAGPVVFDLEGPWVRGQLWQDATVDGVPQQKGDLFACPIEGQGIRNAVAPAPQSCSRWPRFAEHSREPLRS